MLRAIQITANVQARGCFPFVYHLNLTILGFALKPLSSKLLESGIFDCLSRFIAEVGWLLGGVPFVSLCSWIPRSWEIPGAKRSECGSWCWLKPWLCSLWAVWSQQAICSLWVPASSSKLGILTQFFGLVWKLNVMLLVKLLVSFPADRKPSVVLLWRWLY